MTIKLSKAKEKEFFKLVKDEEFDYSEAIKEMLAHFPVLANSVVTGMAKGIDGFSSLTLAIRFYNFDVAKILVEHGADVNFIDSSNVRPNHSPLFFDFIEILRNLIEVGNYREVNNGFELWDLMESNGLDYTQKSVTNDGVNRPDNCIQAFIRLVGVKYGNKHLVHNETKYDPPNPYVNVFRFSDESRDKEKEKWYKRIAKRIIDNVSEDLIGEVDANRGRSLSGAILSFYTENGYVDKFSLVIMNKIVYEKYGYELHNMHDTTYLSRLNDKLTRFASTSHQI